MVIMGKFDTNSFFEGALKGIISKLDARAEQEQEKIKLKRDIGSYMIKEKFRQQQETASKQEQAKIQNPLEKLQMEDYLKQREGDSFGGDNRTKGSNDFVSTLTGFDGSGGFGGAQRGLGKPGGAPAPASAPATGPSATGDQGSDIFKDFDKPRLKLSGGKISQESFTEGSKRIQILGKILLKERMNKPLSEGEKKLKADLMTRVFGSGKSSKSSDADWAKENLGIDIDESMEPSPYEEYPDAFLEDGVWKVEKDGKKYRIEDEE